jgi:CheY-like chemotaxis protein
LLERWLERVTIMARRKESVSQGLVLIADDNPDFISELTKILVDRGYLVLGAKDGRAAAELLTKHRLDFSLAIIDVFMPLVSGMDLIRMLLSNKVDLKIIAVSEGRQKVLDAAILLGADAGIKKPPPNMPLDAKQWLDGVIRQIGLS